MKLLRNQIRSLINQYGVDEVQAALVQVARDNHDKLVAAINAARQPLPYPFCRHPEDCAGRGYCRHDPACNE